MRCSRPIGLVLVTLISMTCSMPSEPPSRLSAFRESQKLPRNNFVDSTSTSTDVLDVRTPPKIRQQVQDKLKEREVFENSHAGVAIPVDEESLKLEETTKKLNFYKIERPTTDSGLSTWILLSGQASPTSSKPLLKNVVSNQSNVEKTKKNSTIILNKPQKLAKPIFRKRPSSTTEKPTTKAPSTTTPAYEVSKLTKVKASELNKAINKRHNSTTSISKKPTTIASVVKKSTTTVNPLDLVSTTEISKNVTKTVTIKTNLGNTTDVTSSLLPVEAKDGDVDLTNGTENKKKKNASKRKKNKNRRRKPEKNSNSTSVAKPTKTSKQKPISTQLYNYLSREIMPTVGVGLVGLMVTAGLASYFLYPFGIARRSYEVDRKDKAGNYYYHDDYSNSMPEEEAIGKVIAGMPSNSDSMSANSLATNTYQNAYMNTRYRLVDRKAQIQPQSFEGVGQGSVEDVPLMFDRREPDNTYNTNYQTLDYSGNLDDKKFVVGNVPDELKEVTPVTVPEHGPRNLRVTFPTEEKNEDDAKNEVHENVSELRPAFGPRSLKIRRKRSGISNEIDVTPIEDLESEFVQRIDKKSTTTTETTEEASAETQTTDSEFPVTTEIPTSTTDGFSQKFVFFLDSLRDLIHIKARVGLQVLQNVSQSFSKYISKAQARLDEHIHNSTRFS